VRSLTRRKVLEEDCGKMTGDIIYKEHLIRGESFQREANGTWVPQYTVIRQNAPATEMDFPSHQYQFNHVYPTQREANEYAVQSAQRWIDRKDSQKIQTTMILEEQVAKSSTD
jgi:hypothetical protein